VKICDLTQFYSPYGGGVRRYLSEKSRHLQDRFPDWRHVLIVPGPADSLRENGPYRIYSVASPLLSRSTGYRILLRREAVLRIIEQERPDLLETADPFQIGWTAARAGSDFGIPVIGFYHSHFPEAYLRPAAAFLGGGLTKHLMRAAESYTRTLYNQFACTVAPSPAICRVLKASGVQRVFHCDLGVDPATFRPRPAQRSLFRQKLGVPSDRILLLWVGRLAPEKNCTTLFEAFRILHRKEPGRFHLVVAGAGLQQNELQHLIATIGPNAPVTWLPDASKILPLPELYAASDLFVHPGVQETFGLVSLEAQASGVPVVGIRGTPMDRIILCGQTHWASENSPAALARAISDTASNPPPAKDLPARVAAAFAWEKVFDRLFGIYQHTLQRRLP
jgi:alpha-1,6-mannosyltransferase